MILVTFLDISFFWSFSLESEKTSNVLSFRSLMWFSIFYILVLITSNENLPSIVFFPYIISVLHLVIFLYICLILSLWLESVTLYLLKFMENTKKSTSIFFPNAYDSSAEYFQRFLFSSIYIFLNKERSVCMFNHKQGGQIILGSPPCISGYY